MSVVDSLVIRPLVAGDVPRIFKDWLMSYHSSPEVRRIPNPVFYHWHHKLLESLMVDPTVVWLVAVALDNPNHIAGWLCAQEFAGGTFLVHYVYVARVYRRLGLASRLLATLGAPKDTGLMVTATTFSGNALLTSRGNAPVYNPYLLLGRSDVPQEKERQRADILAELRRSAKAHRVGYNLAEKPEERE